VNFDHGYLHEHLIPKHARSYQSATPFPHVVIEQMLPPEIVAAVASEISEVMLPSGCVPGASACYHKRGVHIGKSELHDRSHGPYTKALFAALRGRTFVRFLERLSGVHPLIPDPGYQGSGVHLTGKGGILKVHHDFNYMLCRELGVEEGAGEGGGAGERRGARGGEGGASGSGSRFGDCVRGASHHVGGGAERRHRLHRRVNVFVYLNADWPEHYGGHLELWNRNMTRCHRRIAPTIGRFVAFSSSDYSFHGHPQPMDQLPPGRMRRSIAFYYYHLERPVEQCAGGDCESFHDARWQDPVGCAECTACGASRRERRGEHVSQHE